MKNLLILFILLSNNVYCQIQLELDTTFEYEESPPTWFLVRGVRNLIIEDNGNLLVNGYRCYNPGPICTYLNRLTPNGNLVANSFVLISPTIQSPYVDVFYKTQNGFLIYGDSRKPVYKVSANGNIGTTEELYNTTLNSNHVLNNTYMHGGTPYSNPNDGSLIAYCLNNQKCFVDSTAKLMRFLADGSKDTSFNHSYEGFLFQIKRLKNDLFWCAQMRSYDNHSTNYLAKTDTLGKVDTNFTVDTRFDTTVQTNMYAIEKLQSGKLLVMTAPFPAEFVRANGQRDSLQFFRLNANGSLDTTFNNLEINTWRGKVVAEVEELPDGKLLVVGVFNNYSGYPYRSIAVLDSNGFALPNYLHLPKLNQSLSVPPDTSQVGEAYSISKTPDDGYLIYGGFFNLVDGNPSKGLIKLKRFWSVNTPTLTNGLQTLQLYPNPAQNQVRINLGQEIIKVQTLCLRDVSGKLVKTYSITEPNQTLDIGGVAKGLYFVNIPGYRVEKLVIN